MRLLLPLRRKSALPLLAIIALALPCAAEDKKPPEPAPAPDVLVLANGDTLHGKFVKEVSGTVTFHSDPLGDLNVPWAKIQSLHVSENVAVLSATMKARGKNAVQKLPVGVLDATNETVTLHPTNQETTATIPVKDAQYIVDQTTLEQQVGHEPNFFTGWNGTATAGATIVSATQDQYTVSGALGLVRVVPTVSWLNTRDRTSADFNGSFGKITQPAYTSGGVYTPATSTKSSIIHFDAERDEYFAPRFFALAQTAFDHNYSQDLNLQEIYGGGIGWTVVKTPKQEADLKGTLQYEEQNFIAGTGQTNQDLVGSTFAATYLLKLKRLTYTQTLSYIPAWNTPKAYSASETDTLAFPAYRNFSFSLGTLDSYLNDPPSTEPPTKRNSFQFTMGLTYAIKSKY
jgi:Protein of unknown function, DUF481